MTPAEARDHGLVMAAVCMAGRASPAALGNTDPDGGRGLWRRMERRKQGARTLGAWMGDLAGEGRVRPREARRMERDGHGVGG